MTEGGPSSATRLVPDVCDRRVYSGVLPPANDVDLAVAATPIGAAVLAVPRAGGAVHGFRIDDHADLVGGDHTLRDDAAYTSVSAATIDGRLVTASVANKGGALDLLRADLGAVHEVATLDAGLVGEAPFAHARATRVSLSGGPEGIRETAFDGAWAPSSTRLITAAAPSAMSSAPTRQGDLMLAWSTDRACGVEHLAGGASAARDQACANVRIATSLQGGTLVFEDDQGNVRRSTATTAGLGDPVLLGKFAVAPRVAFDGARTWASYLDVHGDVVVGYLDENGTLVSRALEGTRPLPDAYELVLFTDAIWVFAADEHGVSAQRLCLAPANG